jgi:hypothetical protein
MLVRNQPCPAHRARHECRWPQDFESALMSVAEDADILDPRSWLITEPLAFQRSWFPAWVPRSVTFGGYLEGGSPPSPAEMVPTEALSATC